MKKLLVYLPDELHEDLKELAHRRKKSMGELVRKAVEKTYLDDLDVLEMERELEAYRRDPSSAISLDDYLRTRNIALPR